MRDLWLGLRRITAAVLLPIALFLTACDSDPARPDLPEYSEVVVVLNSTERSLTVAPVDDLESSFTIGVSPEGTPVGVAARNETAVVPLGTYPYVAIVDLVEREVTYTVALPDGSGATGVAFLNDSIALVGNSARNSVSPVNVLRGSAGDEIEVGVYPEAIVVADGKAYVLNTELDETWQPARTGTISVIDGSVLQVIKTIELSGYNPGAAEVGGDGRLYVLNAGSWGLENGSLSIVDLSRDEEVAHHDGFGDFPGSIAVAPSGRIMVGAYGTGILEWDRAGGGSFVHDQENPLTPGEVPPVSGIGYDSQGRFFLLTPGGCLDPGALYLLDSDGEIDAEATTGVCPMGLAFTKLIES